MCRESELVDCDFQQTAGADSGVKNALNPNAARQSDVIHERSRLGLHEKGEPIHRIDRIREEQIWKLGG
jgi:hypothetical protein